MKFLFLVIAATAPALGVRLTAGGGLNMWNKIRTKLQVTKLIGTVKGLTPLESFHVTSDMVGDLSKVGHMSLPPHSSRKVPASADQSAKYPGVLQDIQATFDEGGADNLEATLSLIKAAQGAIVTKSGAQETINSFRASILNLRESFTAFSNIVDEQLGMNGFKEGHRLLKEDETEFVIGVDDKPSEEEERDGEEVDDRWEEVVAVAALPPPEVPPVMTDEEREEEEAEKEVNNVILAAWAGGMPVSREYVRSSANHNLIVIEGISKVADVISLWALKHPDEDRFRAMPPNVKTVIAKIFTYCLNHQLGLWFQNDSMEISEDLRNKLFNSLRSWASVFIRTITDKVLEMDLQEAHVIAQDVGAIFSGLPHYIPNPSSADYSILMDYFESKAGHFSALGSSLNDLPVVSPCPARAVYVREILFRLMAQAVESSATHIQAEEQRPDQFSNEQMAYNARGREIVFHFASLLGVMPMLMEMWEKGLGVELAAGVDALQMEIEANDESYGCRKLTSGIMLGVGVGICVTTMALAAPTIAAFTSAAGAATIALGGAGVFVGGILKAVGAALATKVGSIALVGVFGLVGTGLGAWKLRHVNGELKGFDITLIRTKHHQGAATYQVTLGASGMVDEDHLDLFQRDWVEPLDYTMGCSDTYVLEWEAAELSALNRHVFHLVTAYAATSIGKNIGKEMTKTFFSGSLYMLFLPLMGLQTVLNFDTTWKVLHAKAKLAGRALAKALMTPEKIGIRPVQLVGYGMGALAIFHCLLELYKNDAFHIVSDAFLLGVPLGITSLYEPRIDYLSDEDNWNSAASVVSGRFVNGYCPTDWLLLMLQWYQKTTPVVAGAFPTNRIPRVENIDLSSVISDFRDYPLFLGEVLTVVGFSHAAAFMEAGPDSERLSDVFVVDETSDVRFGNPL